VKQFLLNFFKKKKFLKDEKYRNYIIPKIQENTKIITSQSKISFLHYGHLGDIINSLPVIKKISEKKECSLYIQKDKIIPRHVVSRDHPFGNVYLSEQSILKILPLLKKQNFLNKVEIYNDQKIDIDLNFFRDLPINFNIDSVRWYFHLTGIFPDLKDNYLTVDEVEKYKNYIVIMRSLRRQNNQIDYSFLDSYKNIIFVGLKNEYIDLKKKITKLEHHNSKDFLELASIIKSAKLFIGNLSFGYALAEALKTPRLLESGPNFPLVYPNGPKAYDFYFQNHFEMLVKQLYYD
tara:strand:- start:4130 stop:5005 length:876 start_codon:yes stop_codon:yes gene_type:complete